ncbi:hypothetical protein D3C79_793250 [compost metagenome]
MAIQAMVARAVIAPRIEHRQLPFEADGCTTDQRLAMGEASCVDRLPGTKVVGTVQHQVDGRHCSGQGVFIQRLTMGDQGNFRIDGLKPLQRRVHLAHANAATVMDDLALQVGQVDGIEISQVQLTYTGCSQVERHR